MVRIFLTWVAIIVLNKSRKLGRYLGQLEKIVIFVLGMITYLPISYNYINLGSHQHI